MLKCNAGLIELELELVVVAELGPIPQLDSALSVRRNTYMTESRWQNEYDRITTMTNINNWTWLKLKPTNLNLTSEVFLISVPDVFFLLRSKARPDRYPSQCELASRGWGTCPSRPHQHIFGGKVNVCRCHIFQPCSIVKVRRCEKFSVIFYS